MFGTPIEEIRVCDNHGEYEVPLIWTFAFNGAEWWCPYCGTNLPMMNVSPGVPKTTELTDRLKKYKKLSSDFLDAKSYSVCSAMEYKGEKIKPEDLPQSEQDKKREAIHRWEYEQKVD